jgi:UDP-glucose 4-epimerase
VADARKANAILGWRPRYPDIDTIVEHAVRWHERRRASPP